MLPPVANLPPCYVSEPHSPTQCFPETESGMDEVWSWLARLSSSDEWLDRSSPLSLVLAASAGKSILLKAELTPGSNTEILAKFSICLLGFHPSNASRALWVSEPCPLSNPLHPFLLQLLQEVIDRAPASDFPSYLKLDSEAISAALTEAKQAPAFLSLALLCRLFWLCAHSAPAEAGFLFFQSLDPALERALECKRAMGAFLASVGADWEERFMRSLGYMLAKWCILHELQASPPLPSCSCCLSYAVNAHGLWVFKGFAPVPAMVRVGDSASPGSTPRLEANDTVLRYALAHQQLEAVVQLEYSVYMQDAQVIQVRVRVDNIRLHVVRLGFGAKEGGNGDEMERDEGSVAAEERYFPSRVRVWVGPQLGSAYATGPSLGRSTGNPRKEIGTTRTMKGSFGDAQFAKVKATEYSSARSCAPEWWWEQEAEGGAGVFEGVLCDGATGAEVGGWRPGLGGGMRPRYSGAWRAFSKAGGLVVAGDELAEEMSWRMGREMEGKVVKWRIGGKVWVSFLPTELNTEYIDTRCVEWRDEVDLHLVAS